MSTPQRFGPQTRAVGLSHEFEARIIEALADKA